MGRHSTGLLPALSWQQLHQICDGLRTAEKPDRTISGRLQRQVDLGSLPVRCTALVSHQELSLHAQRSQLHGQPVAATARLMLGTNVRPADHPRRLRLTVAINIIAAHDQHPVASLQLVGHHLPQRLGVKLAGLG